MKYSAFEELGSDNSTERTSVAVEALLSFENTSRLQVIEVLREDLTSLRPLYPRSEMSAKNYCPMAERMGNKNSPIRS